MKSKKVYLGLTAIILFLAVGITSVSAYQGDYSKAGPNCTPERHEAMDEAMANNDYSAWKELMAGKGRVTQVINESNFAKFVDAHNLADTDPEAADEIRAELGLRTRDGQGIGAAYRGGGKMQGKGLGNGQGNRAIGL